ncbi:hypothetical protein SAY86_023223 [Trapa natans]|uniref:Uncharacterized protein n=1 Tax=Trapa natans TaxID=22666 RepID=A0AAN7M711_TRANT|nr:hypothetical protein SAY86_023223 [Trapa natans]
MDKNKNRTDLLAAGRKKLQQFRQKKDVKDGTSQGKSQKMASKSEQLESSAVDAASRAHDTEVETASQYLDNAVLSTSISALPASEDSIVSQISKISSEAPADAGQPSNDSGVDKHVAFPTQVEGESTNVGSLHGNVSPPGITEIPDFQEKFPHASIPPAATPLSYEEKITADESLESAEDSFFTHEYILVGSLNHAKGSQVGEEQEANILVPGQSNGDGELEPGRYTIGPTSEITVALEAPCTSTPTTKHVEEARFEMVQEDDSSVSAVHLASAPQADENLTISNECKDQQREDRFGFENQFHTEISSSDKKVDEAEMRCGDFEEHSQHLGGRVSKDSSCELNVDSENASSTGLTMLQFADYSFISLNQLIDVVKRLGVDEYNLLLTSRDISCGNVHSGGGTCSRDCVHKSDLEQLEEELFMANFREDILFMQLKEHFQVPAEFNRCQQHLANETSMFQTAIDAVNKKNDSLTEHLILLKSELLAVTNGRDHLQNQLNAKKMEVEGLHERVCELQTALEAFQQNFSSQSIELADCRASLAALQMENHKLGKDIELFTKEGNLKEEEKKNISLMNEKLSTKLADSQNLLDSLKGELSVMGDSLSSVSCSEEKLKEEKKCLTCENEKLSTILAEYKHLVEELQIENDGFSQKLRAVLTELDKTREEREGFNTECERLSSEIVFIKEQLSSEKAGCMQIEDDLREKLISFDKLADENKSLRSTLDMYVAQISELSSIKFQDLFAGDACNQFQHLGEAITKHARGVTLPVTDSVLSQHVSPHELVDEKVSAVFSGSEAMKEQLLELDNMLQKLAMVISDMHSHSTNSNKSDKGGAAPGISKLIQAFELKGHLSEPNQDIESKMEDHSLIDPYVIAKEHIRDLILMAKQLSIDADNVALLLRKMEVQSGISKEYECDLEAHAIELGILYEVTKQQLSDSKLEKVQFETLCENLKQNDVILREENKKLSLKLEGYESRVNDLQNELHDLQCSSGDLTSCLGEQLETLQREVTESAVMKQLRSTIVSSQIVESLEKVGIFTSMISAQTSDELDLDSYVTSINAAINVIENLQQKMESVDSNQKAVYYLFQEANENLHILQGKNDLAVHILHHLHDRLSELVFSSSRSMELDGVLTEEKQLLDPLDESKYDLLLKKVETILGERQQTASEVIALQSQLSDRMLDIQELEAKCIDMESIQRLIGDVLDVVDMETVDCNLSGHPLSLLESLIHVLVHKYMENKDVSLSLEEIKSKEMQLTELQEKLSQWSSLNLQHENEIIVLRESLAQSEEAIVAVRAELKDKAVELEQSEQRVSSIREKLSIAVAKGKGLVVQRDHLKQTLAETSSELEKCMKELEFKNDRIHEVEAKLMNYSEAGERVEALESELSYIRHSATALRESFFLKDSLLQRIEEILEDLDLPEHFHLKDIIEKVDWLARLATANGLPNVDLDQKSLVGGSYVDSGLVVMDTWKDDMQPISNQNEDMRMQYDELQGKFYGLAEQNEMLEQSLMERNNLLQRWEGLLDRMYMPTHIRSVEPEEKIEWLANALSEAHQERISLVQKIDDIETHCGSLTSDIEDSHCKISNLQNEVKALVHQTQNLSQRLELLTLEDEQLLMKVLALEVEKEILLSRTSQFHEVLAKMIEMGENAQWMDHDIQHLQNMVSELLYPVREDFSSIESSTEILTLFLKQLIEKYTAASADTLVSDGDKFINKNTDATAPELRTREADNKEEHEQGAVMLKKELAEALGELMQVKEQRDEFLEKNTSLIDLVGTLEKKRDELQTLLDMEEQKCVSVREKLNVAVRKGKSLVQQRDVMKSTIEEMNKEVDRLKSNVNRQEDALAKCEQKIQELSFYPKKVDVLESEISHLQNQLREIECYWKDKEHTLNLILRTLAEIDVGSQDDPNDPVEKIRQIQEICSDLRVDAASLEKESKKLKRAAELLLVELNEVQERNDNLQEQIAEATSEISRLYDEKNAALLQLNNLSSQQLEERRSILSEFMKLKSAVEPLKKMFSDFEKLMADVLWQDIEILKKIELSMESCLQQNLTSIEGIELSISNIHLGLDFCKVDKENFMCTYSGPDYKLLSQIDENLIKDFSIVGNHLQDLFEGIYILKEDLQKHFTQSQEQASNLSKGVTAVHREIDSRKETSEVMERDIKHLTLAQKEKDMEILSLRRNLTLLHEACSITIMEIKNSKATWVQNSLSTVDHEVHRDATRFTLEGSPFDGHTGILSEESIRSFAERLILEAKGLSHAKDDAMEVTQKQLKNRVADLEKELQEKDLQKDRICMEFVGQIKVAEAAATCYLSDLQSTKALVEVLEKQVKGAEKEQKILEEKIQSIQEKEVAVYELEQRLKSLTDLLSSKDQEIEALMQALDEEEVHMDGLTKKIGELEKAMQQKDLIVSELEVSRGKALKKLSITTSKFHELHHFSSSFLAEVEKLQMQLKEKDSEISFLRQEVTRCTNDALAAMQLSNNRNSEELFAFLTWFDTMISQVASHELENEKTNQVQEYTEILQKKFTSIISELESLRVSAENAETLLQAERSKIEEFRQRESTLEKSLLEKESQLNLLQGFEDPGPASGMSSEIVKIEPVINKRGLSASTAPHVRSLRKPNNDQVSISIDMDPSSSTRLEDDDDDKVHGFKSLATSRIIPKFTRRVTDMVDGLWVSCDRALMRQPRSPHPEEASAGVKQGAPEHEIFAGNILEDSCPTRVGNFVKPFTQM